MNYRMIRNILGWILLFEAGFLLVPLITSVIYWEDTFFSILASIGLCIIFGLLLTFPRAKKTAIYAREGFVIVTLSWVLLSFFGALPFWFSREIPSLLDAVFETVSGFTTTGGSILEEIETMSRSLLLWRSFTHWVGGMGVLVFVMAILPLSGGHNLHIMRAESPGPSVSKLVPRIQTTALILYAIYFVLTALQCILLVCGGLSFYESLNLAFSTAGTGGFGIRNNSAAEYSSYIQIVITVFMLLFSINFNSFYLLLLRKWRDAFNVELKTFLAIVLGSVILLVWNIRHLFPSLGEAIKHGFFTVASIISTTGFYSINFDEWSEFAKVLLLLLMFIGACAGSTGGGMKVSRIIILFKSMKREMSTMIHPKQIKKVTVDQHPLETEVLRSVRAYLTAYIFLFIGSLAIITLTDRVDFLTGFSSVATTINNVGPGFNLIDPTSNYAFYSAPGKLILILDMLAGRLELFPVLLLFTPSFWKK
ncbi:MAG: TrkH family potassium uptake protein [Clostridia bacterium]|nr:TrkH family potassium uptake protein [Clostridia bacterium]